MGMYPSGHENKAVAAVVFLLDDWLRAMEDGTVGLRLPDPRYSRGEGIPSWTEEELDRIIRDIDAEIDQEVVRAPGTSVGAKAGPEFKRLPVHQRLALVQQLHSMMKQHEGHFPDDKAPVGSMASGDPTPTA